MTIEDAFMAVLHTYLDTANWKVREKKDEYRDMRDDPETSPGELDEVRRELAYERGYRAALQYVLDNIEDDVREHVNDVLNSRENQQRAVALYDEWRNDAIRHGIYWTREQEALYYDQACARFFG